ncbi:ribonuclease H-like domain-containing protein [Tanacetum coccineum]
MESQSETTQTLSALKLPMLKTRDYELWSMRMEQYLTHTDYALWEVIINGDAPVAVASASASAEDEHLLKFYSCKDAKSLWEAINNRFGGNKDSKKMQKTILKQQYKNFVASRSDGLDKTYDRFQKLISQLEIHGEEISQEDANLKLLRSLPSAWNNIALIMRNKVDLDTLSMDDLYNNLKVFEAEIKGHTNEAVNTTHDVSTAGSKGQASTSTYADDVMFSFFATQSNSPQLDNENLEQIDFDDLEEIDLKWQVAMLTMRLKRFIKKTGRNLNFNGKETVGFDKTKVECYNCHRRGHFARECRVPRNQGNRNGDNARRVVPVETSTNALVVQDGIEQFDKQKEQLNKASLEIIGYQMGLESLEAKIVVHEKNEAIYEEKIAFLKYDVQVKDISIKDLKNHANDKTGLGYGNQLNESELNINESEVVHSVFNSRDSDVDDNPVNDRFKTVEGFHAVPSPTTGNFMP